MRMKRFRYFFASAPEPQRPSAPQSTLPPRPAEIAGWGGARGAGPVQAMGAMKRVGYHALDCLIASVSTCRRGIASPWHC